MLDQDDYDNVSTIQNHRFKNLTLILIENGFNK